MSRKGKFPVPMPKGVEASAANGEIRVKGPRGTMQQSLLPGIEIELQGDHLNVLLSEEHKDKGNMHGLYRSLINNMVVGVSTGFEKKLEMRGVGYRANLQGDLLDLQVGYSHPTKLQVPTGISIGIEEKNTVIIVKGNDKQAVGQFAAAIRSTRPPEPYQGKGIRYVGEFVRKKAGKTASKK